MEYLSAKEYNKLTPNQRANYMINLFWNAYYSGYIKAYKPKINKSNPESSTFPECNFFREIFYLNFTDKIGVKYSIFKLFVYVITIICVIYVLKT